MIRSQKKYRFDKISLKKMGRGFLIAMSGGAALGGLNFLGTIEIDSPAFAVVVATLVPALVNLVKEFIQGK